MAGFEHLLVGQILGRHYRIDEVLGGGGFGVVFRATDLRPGRACPAVAVKVLSLPAGVDAAGHARLRERFRHEAAFAAALPRHPNVVPIYDYGSDQGLDFLVMELLHGEDLRHRLLRPEPLPLAQALRVLRDAARGVAVGHGAGLVHRDVKPANVFLEAVDGEEPVVRVLDFGIAKRIEDDGDRTPTHLTRHGEGFFSGRYASPEQLRRETGITRASDVFSLGVVGFELLTRSRLFNDADQQRRETGSPVPIPSLAARNGQVPPRVEQVIVQALDDDPRRRFRDAAVFAEALQQACRASAIRLDAASTFAGASPAAEEAPDEGTIFAGPETVFAAETRLAGTRTAEGEAGTAFAEEGTASPDEPPAGKPARRWFGRRKAAPAVPPHGERRATVGPGALRDLEEERRLHPEPSRWSRRADIPRRRLVAMAAAVFLLIGAALGLSAVAAAGGTGLLGRLWGRLSGAEAARQDRIDARDANAEGRRLFARGQFGPALERFRRAHELEPEVAEYHNNVGWALFKLKRGPEAVRVLEAVVRKHPDRHLAYENLAAAHLIAGDTAAALATLEHLLSAGPGAARRRTAERLLARLRQPAPAADTAFLDPGTVVESEGTPETPAWMTPAPVVEADWTAPVQVDTFAAPATAETESTPAAVATPVSHRQREERTVPPRKPGSRRGAPRDTVFVARPDRFADTVHIRPL